MVVRFRSDSDRMFWFQMSWPVRALIKMSVERNWQPINLSTATFIKEHMWWPFRLWWGGAVPLQDPLDKLLIAKQQTMVTFVFLLKMFCWLLKISYCELRAFYRSQRETFPTKTKIRLFMKTLQNTTSFLYQSSQEHQDQWGFFFHFGVYITELMLWVTVQIHDQSKKVRCHASESQILLPDYLVFE